MLTIAFLLVETLLPPDVSLITIIGQLLIPQSNIRVHPYITTGLLFVSVSTLLLFFASGMYYEKIAYANKYVPFPSPYPPDLIISCQIRSTR